MGLFKLVVDELNDDIVVVVEDVEDLALHPGFDQGDIDLAHVNFHIELGWKFGRTLRPLIDVSDQFGRHRGVGGGVLEHDRRWSIGEEGGKIKRKNKRQAEKRRCDIQVEGAFDVGSYNWKERNAAIGTNRSFREL